jgi:hypothetical protein
VGARGGDPPRRGPEGAGAPADPGRRAPVERKDLVASNQAGPRVPDKTDRTSGEPFAGRRPSRETASGGTRRNRPGRPARSEELRGDAAAHVGDWITPRTSLPNCTLPGGFVGYRSTVGLRPARATPAAPVASRGLAWNRTLGRPPSGARTASGRSHPSFHIKRDTTGPSAFGYSFAY